MVRHIDLALNGGPALLAELYWQPHGASSETWRWTTQGLAPGCLDVAEAQWQWLLSQPLAGPEPRTGAARRWERRKLVFDPSAGLGAAGVPTSGSPVAAPGGLPLLPENPWEVRLYGGRGEVTFPFCRVNLTASVATVPQGVHYYRAVQPMSVECYPEDRAGEEDQAILDALEVLQVLERAFRHDAGLGAARPLRVPLFDYDGVPLTAGVQDRRSASDFMRVEDFAGRHLPDPQDSRRVAAVADVRVAWDVPAYVAEKGRWPVERVGISQVGT